jgi:type II secretory pathway pseudopilin PulG
LSKIGGGWSGQAATATSGALSQLADHADSASQVSTAGSTHLDGFSENFTSMKNTIQQELVNEGQQSAGGNALDALLGRADGLFGIQSDFRRRQQANQAAHAQAVQALNTYRDTTSQRLTDFQVGQPVPNVTAGGPGPGGPGHGPKGSDATPRATPGTPGSTSTANADSPPKPTDPGTPGPGSPGTGPGGPGREPATSTAPSSAPPPMSTPDNPDPANPYRPGGGPTPTWRPRVGSRRGGPLPQRAPGQPSLITEALDSQLVGPTGEPKPGVTPGGMPPGMGAGKGEEREHRNNTFIPSSEPFEVELVEFRDYTPPVLGLNQNDEVSPKPPPRS